MKSPALCLSLAAALFYGAPAQAALFDHSAYDEILSHYVSKDGGVDYAGIRENSDSALQSYFERLGDADTTGWPYPEKLAFWINAYNAHVIQCIVEHPDMKKISDNFEIFNKPVKIAGHMLSVNDVLFRVLRSQKNPDNQGGAISNLSLPKLDPRIHFALVAGAMGSPRLQNVAYTAENIEDLLKEDVQKAVASNQFVDVQDGKLYVNAILRWYGKDFLPLGGWRAYMYSLVPEDALNAMALRGFLKEDVAKPIYRFDWTINDAKNIAPQEAAPAQHLDSAISEPSTPL